MRGIRNSVLIRLPIGITMVVLDTVFNLKRWLPRKKVRALINSSKIQGYKVDGNVGISVEDYNSLDKLFLSDKLNKERLC